MFQKTSLRGSLPRWLRIPIEPPHSSTCAMNRDEWLCPIINSGFRYGIRFGHLLSTAVEKMAQQASQLPPKYRALITTYIGTLGEM